MLINNFKIIWKNYREMADSDKISDEEFDAIPQKVVEVLKESFPGADIHVELCAEDEDDYFQETVIWYVHKVALDCRRFAAAVSKLSKAEPEVHFHIIVNYDAGDDDLLCVKNGRIATHEDVFA